MDDAIALEKQIAEIRVAMAKQAALLLDEQIMQDVSTTDKDKFDPAQNSDFERLKPTRLTKYQWRQMNPQRLHNELREIWALVTKHPGCSLRFIANELDITLSRSKRLVDLLLRSGTLIRDAGRIGTLRVSIPLITIGQV